MFHRWVLLLPFVLWNILSCTNNGTTARTIENEETVKSTRELAEPKEENRDIDVLRADIQELKDENRMLSAKLDEKLEEENQIINSKMDSLVELMKSNKEIRDEKVEKVETSIEDQIKAMKKDLIQHLYAEHVKGSSDVEGTRSELNQSINNIDDADDDDDDSDGKCREERLEIMVKMVNDMKNKATEAVKKVKKEINDNPKFSASKKEDLNREADAKAEKIHIGANNSLEAYKKLEDNVASGNGRYNSKKLKKKTIEGLKTLGSNLKDGSGSIVDGGQLVGDTINQFKTMFDPTMNWQDRAKAGVDFASNFFAILPSPFGDIGSAVLGIISSFLAAPAPTPNEFKLLRNEILNGVSEMFDSMQKADAMGCIYKIEFLKDVLDAQNSTAISEKEFNAFVIAGGIDVGVSTLGTLKWKMEEYRDNNNIIDGRRALEMAQFFVLVSDARDLLIEQIVNFLKLSEGTEHDSGYSTRFFEKTKQVSQSQYKDLFWWDDACCKKNPKHFSALLAFSLPLNKHSGKDKAVATLQRFLRTHRTQKYYNDTANQVDKDDALSVDIKPSDDVPPQVGHIDVQRILDETQWYSFGTLYHKTVKLDTILGLKGEVKVDKATLKCDTKEAEHSVKRIGLTGKLDKNSKLRIRFPTNREAGDPYTATVTVDTGTERNPYEMFAISKNQLLQIKDSLPAESLDIHNKIVKSTYGEYKKGDMFLMCPRGKTYANQDVDWKQQLRKQGYIRLFPVKMPGWGETRYLIGPSAENIDDDLILFGTPVNVGKQVEVPDVESEEKKPKPEITEQRLDTEAWKKVFFVIRYTTLPESSGKSSTDRRSTDWAKYPTSLSGKPTYATCSWRKKQPIYDESFVFLAKDKDLLLVNCASACLDRKVRGTFPRIGAAALYNHDNYCYCYWNVTGYKDSTYYDTCFYNTAEGCCYNVKVTIDKKREDYHLGGMLNGLNYWTSKTGKFALWSVPQDNTWVWCIGDIQQKGKGCSKGMWKGAPAYGKPDCPDMTLVWKKIDNDGTENQLRQENFDITCIPEFDGGKDKGSWRSENSPLVTASEVDNKVEL